MQYDRLTSEKKLAELLKSLDKRIKSVETKGTGTISWTDDAGVETIIGELPDGTTGFQPFVNDIVPPPVATAPEASAGVGAITVAWDGLFVNGEAQPADFQHLKVLGHRVVDGAVTLTVEVGMLRKPLDSVYVNSDVAAVNETWKFSFASVDYNGNTSAESAFSSTVTQTSYKTDVEIASAISSLSASVSGAQSTADGKNTNYYGISAPSGGSYRNGDQWFDTDDGNKLYLWTGASWVPFQDADIAAAQDTADSALTSANGKNKVYYQTAMPTGGTYTSGDTWFDTDDGNRIYVHNGTTFVDAQDSDISAAQSTANTANNTANSALTTANSKTKTYFQTAQPGTSGNTVGDMWFDTDDSNKVYVWNGSSWASARDAGIASAASAAATAQTSADSALSAAQAAQAVADGAIRTFYQSGAPTGLNDTTNVGDLWFDTDDGQAYRWNGTSWVIIEDNSIAAALAAAQNAQTTADGKITSYYQPGQPATGEVGDLWFDTDDKNKPYYCSSISPLTWSVVRDGTIADAQTTANTALTSANGKNRNYYQTSMPTGGTYIAGDTWFDTDDGNKIYVHNGTTFVNAQDTAIATAQSTANTKTKTYFQTTSPGTSGNTTGDIWFDTDDGNKPYVWNGSAWASAQDATIAAAQGTANTALTSANGKNKVYYQTAMPTGGTYIVGDTWFDTDDGNKIYVHNGTTFVNAQDTAISTAQTTANSALTTANSKVKTYFQSAQPGTSGNTTGDIWFDTDDGNKVYVWNGSSWTTARDAGIAAAQTSADGKSTTFYQTAQPSTTGRVVGDTWFDTDDGNKIYVWNGSAWTASQDAAIAAAQSAANTAQTTANNKTKTFIQGTAPTATTTGDIWIDTANGNVIKTWEGSSWVTRADAAIAAAQSTANAAQTSANGRNKVYYQTAQPTGGTYILGDTWFDTDDGNKIYVHNGTTWVATALGSSAIADLAITNAKIADATIQSAKIGSVDAGTITVGTLNAARIGADSITSAHIGADAITATELAAGSITAAKGQISDLAVTNAKIADAAITTAKIGDAAITTAKIGDAQITNAKISSLDAGKITAGTIDAARIGADTITATHIAANAVTADELAANSITAAKGQISDAAITTAKIADAQITTAKIANLAVTDAQIANTTITNAKIANLDAAKITTGTLDANRIGANTIAAHKIFVGDFTNLAADGNFTDTTKANWTGSGTVVLTANEPNKIEVVTAASGNNDQANRNTFQVTAGEQIYGEVWVYGETTNVGNGGPNMHLVLTSNAGTSSWPAFGSATRAAVSGVWTKISGTITIPGGTKTGKVELAVSYSADAVGNKYYFREVSVRRKASGNLIVDGAIQAGSAIIANGAIGNAQIGNLAVGTAQIQDTAITTAKIANLAVTDAQIAAATITSAKIANLDAAKITTGTLDAGRIGADTITASHIAADAVTANELAANSITAAKGQISDLAVTTAKIANAAITSAKIEDLAVTDAKIANATISSAKIANLDAGKITTGTLDAGRIGANSILTTHLSSGNIDAAVLSAGSITSNKLAAKSITADKLVITSTDNLVQEGTFNASGVSWELPANFAINATAGRNSTPAMVITNTASLQTSYNAVGSPTKVPIEVQSNGGVAYRVIGWVNSSVSVPVSGAYVSVRFLSSSGTTSVSSVYYKTGTPEALATIPANTWTEISGVVITPPNTISVAFSINSAPELSSGTLKWDMVSVTRAATGSLIVDGAIDGKTIIGSTILTSLSAATSGGIIFDRNKLAAYNSSGSETFRIDAATGKVTSTGAFGTFETLTTQKSEGDGTMTLSAKFGTLDYDTYTEFTGVPGIQFNRVHSVTGDDVPATIFFDGQSIVMTTDDINDSTWKPHESSGEARVGEGYVTLSTYSTGVSSHIDYPSPVLELMSGSEGNHGQEGITARVTYYHNDDYNQPYGFAGLEINRHNSILGGSDTPVGSAIFHRDEAFGQTRIEANSRGRFLLQGTSATGSVEGIVSSNYQDVAGELIVGASSKVKIGALVAGNLDSKLVVTPTGVDITGTFTYPRKTKSGVTFNNSWADFGSGFHNMYVSEVAPDVMVLVGMPKPGTISEGVTVATLPVAYRPTATVNTICAYRTATPSNVVGLIQINIDGTIKLFGAPSNTSYALINVTYFKTAAAV